MRVSKKNYRIKQKTVTKLPDIQFYCGLNEKYWNYHAVEPGTHVCIAPVTSINVEDKKTGEKRRKLVRTQVFIDGSILSTNAKESR